MEFYGVWKRRGRVRVTTWRRNSSGVWTPGDVDVIDNLITNDGLDLFARAIRSNEVDTQILYFGLGDENTSVAATDSVLPNTGSTGEFFRKQIVEYTVGPSIGEVTTSGYIAPSEANQQIYNIGWFGENADGTVETGTMIAAVDYSRLKVNDEAIQIDRTDTFS